MKYSTVSSDSHINEPPDLWERHLPKKLRERGPRLVPSEDGTHEVWIAEGLPPSPLVSGAHAAQFRAAGKDTDMHAERPITRHEMMPGSYDPAARIKDQDADGLDGEVLYPGLMSGLGASGVSRIPDEELRRACVRAYNDWLAEFCSYAPDRLFGIAVVDIVSPEFAIEELERAASLGLKGAVIDSMPDQLGGAPLWSRTYDGFWAKAEEVGLPLSLHLLQIRGFSELMTAAIRDAGIDPAVLGNRKSPIDLLGSLSGDDQKAILSRLGLFGVVKDELDMAEPIVFLIASGVLERHPNLKFVLAETGIGWIPHALERLDYGWDRYRLSLNVDLPQRPSTYWHNNMFATFQQDNKAGILCRHMIGVGNIMWASDYPHGDSTWPFSHKIIDELLGDIPKDEQRKIVVENVAKLYGLS